MTFLKCSDISKYIQEQRRKILNQYPTRTPFKTLFSFFEISRHIYSTSHKVVKTLYVVWSNILSSKQPPHVKGGVKIGVAPRTQCNLSFLFTLPCNLYFYFTIINNSISYRSYNFVPVKIRANTGWYRPYRAVLTNTEFIERY